MKTQIKTLLTDLKAACIIGHPESVEVALDGFLTLPEISSNRRLEDAILQKAVYPAGELLGRSRLPSGHISAYLNAPLTAYRAIAAWALGFRYGVNEAVSEKILASAGKDERDEVRKALANGLCQETNRRKTALLRLGRDWLGDPSIRLNTAALYFLPCVIHQLSPQIVSLLQPLRISLPGGSEKQHALADALARWGRGESASQVFDLLLRWASDPESDVWLITHVLDTLWHEAGHQTAQGIISALERNFPEDSTVRKLHRKLAGEQG